MLQGMQGLILDLRGNPGGRLDIAVAMAEVFLRRGAKGSDRAITQGRGRSLLCEGHDGCVSTTADRVDRWSIARVRLKFSLELCEIMRGQCLVGEKSYGKGSVQSVYSFPDGDGLKLTSARYLLPSGEAINGTGVYPNVTVERSTEEAILLMLQAHHLRHMSD